MLLLFMLLSTLINQEGGRFYCKLQKMFILSRAVTIGYMAYPSFQRKEKILRNSQGKLIFKAVGGRGDKKTNSTGAAGTQSPAQPSAAGTGPVPAAAPQREGLSWGQRLETPRQRQTAAGGRQRRAERGAGRVPRKQIL